jgi:metal-responsive CopG/Arc/MetJ family transcriptional regulator
MGKKRVKNEPVFYDEIKKDTMLTLTETARNQLDERAAELGISRSELVERFARGLIGLAEHEQTAKKRKRSQKLLSAG